MTSNVDKNPIDGAIVPEGDGSTDPDFVTRDLEILLEAEIAALVRIEGRHAAGRRVAYMRVVSRLRALRAILGDNEEAGAK